ncbi:hypothetical protein KTS45_05175 [Halomicroarcula limicola]|uniref:Uncharacterized protein n=1 Tax=Haloarcula limicola TaxID=1429915 RepID=A0A8J7Y3Z2_9EURY|nr:hypothetical protein [Halomicroarcula limicola]MBV0923587.1 hypothetical protein [Halomicroarcula limicola]
MIPVGVREHLLAAHQFLDAVVGDAFAEELAVLLEAVVGDDAFVAVR